MLMKKFVESLGLSTPTCASCGERPAGVHMHGYAATDIDLCGDCALQLARRLLEDLCKLRTVGSRDRALTLQL